MPPHLMFDAQIVEYVFRLPYRINGDDRHDRCAHEKKNADSLICALVFEQATECSPGEQSGNGRNRQEDVPRRADLTGDGMLSADHCSQSVLSACDKKASGRKHNERTKEN